MTKIGAQTFNKKGEVDYKEFEMQEHGPKEDAKYFALRGANVLL